MEGLEATSNPTSVVQGASKKAPLPCPRAFSIWPNSLPPCLRRPFQPSGF